MEQDKDDKAIQQYKDTLLGDVSKSIIDDKDPRQVFFDKLLIKPVDHDEIVLNPNKVNKDKVAFTLKEGSRYNIEIHFRVQREIVLGLKKLDLIYRKAVRVDKSTEMMGSFAPTSAKTYTYKFPEQTTPSGILARGQYTAKTSFVDDDGTAHVTFEYTFRIAKDWESNE